jgi:hypothetical protein
MTGSDYANLIAAYLVANFSERGLEIYPEVNVGKSIIGKNRRVDLFVVDGRQNLALAIECKYQGTAGTTDEKVPYTLQDLEAMRMPGCAAYAGEGWSSGVRHMLESSAARRLLSSGRDLLGARPGDARARPRAGADLPLVGSLARQAHQVRPHRVARSVPLRVS